MSFSCQKGEFDRFFNRLDRPVEESRPDRQPDRPVKESRPDRPVDPTGFHLWFTSNEHVNLYTTLDFKAAEVLDFRLKYDPVFSEV